VLYEAYGPGGVAIMIQAVTDNPTRTVADVRHKLSRNHGNMGSSNSVAYLFERKGQMSVSADGVVEDTLIEAALEAEEKDLTSRRAAMPREEFAPLSEAFNEKVEGIRKAQDAKTRELQRRFDSDRQRFLEVARPILAEVMAARGAVAIIDSRAVFVGFENIDITDAAIAQLDAAMKEGRLTPGEP
jgi:transcriptional/translational regulatory protein YebC/TACO1